MNEQDKQLLLKVLCAMLPYGVKIFDKAFKEYKYSNVINIGNDYTILAETFDEDIQYFPKIDDIKIYLRIPKGCKARIEGNKVIIERIKREDELTKFEKEVKDLMNSCCNEIEEADITNELAKEAASNLLDLARKELQPEFDKEMDKLLAETDKVVYQKGQQDALKDLPKWKKVDSNPAKFQYNLQGKRLYKNGEYYIDLIDLDKLPTEA